MKVLFLTVSLLCFARPGYSAIALVEKEDGWKVELSGFVAPTFIYDTTKSFAEVIGNAPVLPPNGQKGRTQFSLRNSRFAFNIIAPAVNDWKSRGYFEFDLAGYNLAPPNNSEASFSNNPTFRIRHGYMNSEKNGWQFLLGQTWGMLGWQPHYFIPSIQVAPITGTLYSRTTQIRAIKSLDLSESSALQLGLGIMRPPQKDGNFPALEGGARWMLNSWKGAFTSSSTGSHKPQPLSVALSGTVRNFEIPTDPMTTGSNTASHTGMGGAVNILVPVIPSSDGKEIDNNLILGGEFTIGRGVGDQFNGWTGNQKNPLSAATSGANAGAPDKNVNLDAGIGGFDSNNNFHLLDVQAFNVFAQYHLPERMKTWLALGYAELMSTNMSAIQIVNGTNVAYSKDQAIFANISHECTSQIRVAFEFANIQTSYIDGTMAQNNRLQLSTWFIF